MSLKLLVVALLVGMFIVPPRVSAQGMMGRFFNNQPTQVDQSSTAQDEAKGKQIFDQLQAKQTTCQQLTDDDYDVLGDYFMGQMAGNTAVHAQMNSRMTQMMGENGEKQMHIALGKRLSGCDTQAAFPTTNSGFFPMMGLGGMMGSWGSNWNGNDGGMMNYLNSYVGFNWLPILIFWLPLTILVVLLIKRLFSRQK